MSGRNPGVRRTDEQRLMIGQPIDQERGATPGAVAHLRGRLRISANRLIEQVEKADRLEESLKGERAVAETLRWECDELIDAIKALGGGPVTADAVEQPTVPEEAIEAAFDNLFHREDCAHVDALSEFRPKARERLRDALAAAVPVIERQLRARLADEIEAAAVHEHVGSWHPHAALIFAARIVRGEQP